MKKEELIDKELDGVTGGSFIPDVPLPEIPLPKLSLYNPAYFVEEVNNQHKIDIDHIEKAISN